MIGHLKPSFCRSSIDSKENYWEFYCSLCASLRQQNQHIAYSLLLSNELTLVLSAFQDEYETLSDIKTRCPAAALLVRRFAFSNEAIDTAAQFSVVLAWIKALDSHTDRPHFLKKLIVHKLYKKVVKILPTLQPESQAIITKYAKLTQENEQDFSIIRAQSAELSRMIVREIGSKTNASTETTTLIQEVFGRAGELIAIADHLIDLEKDQEKKQYNPILLHAAQNKTPIAEEYQKLLIAFNQLKYEIAAYLPQTNPDFAIAFQQSMHHVERKINKNLPACMYTEEAQGMVGKVQMTKAGFDNPDILPAVAPCCDPQCCSSCISTCCEVAAQGCCQDTCNSCCSGDCCKGDSGKRAERKLRRQERRQARQEKRASKHKTNTEPDDETYR